MNNEINTLAVKAASAEKGLDAMHFAQAALNLGHLVAMIPEEKVTRKPNFSRDPGHISVDNPYGFEPNHPGHPDYKR